MKSGLIIFLKNLRYGKVKTRLAASLGHDTALEIYKLLLQHTRRNTMKVDADKFLFYSDKVEDDDWPVQFFKFVQHGNDLGERMQNAFQLLFKNGYEKLVIVGSDCFELSSAIIEKSFSELEKADAVIGPAKDGGYYLLALKKDSPFVFQNIDWSTEKVLEQTIGIFKEQKMTYSMLEMLSDIDEPEDWLNAKQTFYEQ